VLGRWLNRDPIGERGGNNLYQIVRNATLNFIDAFGLETWWDSGNRIRHNTDPSIDSNRPDLANGSKNLEEIVRSIKEEKQRRGKACDCIRELYLISHGNAAVLRLSAAGGQGKKNQRPEENSSVSEPAKNTYMDATNVASVGKFLKEQVPFCKPCTIWFSSCSGFAFAKRQEFDVNKGENTERTIGKAIAEETSCTVKFSKGSTTSSNVNPTESVMNELNPGDEFYQEGAESGTGIYDEYQP